MAKPLDQMSDNDIDSLVKEEEEIRHFEERRRQKQKKVDEGEMSFLDHLEVLRWHLIRSIIVIVVLMIVVFSNSKFVFGTIIKGPSKNDFPTYQFLCYLSELMSSKALCIDNINLNLMNTALTGQLLMHISTSLILGFILAFPYIFWELWRFIKPALSKGERNVARGAVFYVSTLFFIGVLFGYYIIAPLSVNFLSNYNIGVENKIIFTDYVSTITTIVMASAILFQLPVIAYFLSKIGIVTPKLMKQFRRHAIVVILLLSAIITPPDIFSQVFIAIPLVFLYEISIGISKRIERKRMKSIEKEVGYIE